MIYRCWEDGCEDEPGPNGREFLAACPEDAAETYAELIEDYHDHGSGIDVNVSAQNGSERIYWTVRVDVGWSPDFSARSAVQRDGKP